MPRIGANNKAESNGRPTCASEAQRLCARGFSVVPCDGKKATVKGWPEKRLTRKELREAFEGNRLNIAIALNQSDSPKATIKKTGLSASGLGSFGVGFAKCFMTPPGKC